MKIDKHPKGYTSVDEFLSFLDGVELLTNCGNVDGVVTDVTFVSSLSDAVESISSRLLDAVPVSLLDKEIVSSLKVTSEQDNNSLKRIVKSVFSQSEWSKNKDKVLKKLKLSLKSLEDESKINPTETAVLLDHLMELFEVIIHLISIGRLGENSKFSKICEVVLSGYLPVNIKGEQLEIY